MSNPLAIRTIGADRRTDLFVRSKAPGAVGEDALRELHGAALGNAAAPIAQPPRAGAIASGRSGAIENATERYRRVRR